MGTFSLLNPTLRTGPDEGEIDCRGLLTLALAAGVDVALGVICDFLFDAAEEVGVFLGALVVAAFLAGVFFTAPFFPFGFSSSLSSKAESSSFSFPESSSLCIKASSPTKTSSSSSSLAAALGGICSVLMCSGGVL